MFMNEKPFFRTVLKITTGEGEEIWFDLMSKLGDGILPYVQLWTQVAEEINQENFCNFISNYGIEAYPYTGQDPYDDENPNLLFCDHDYNNINGILRCKKCGNKL